MLLSPGGGIGRHKGLKIPRRQLRAGSSPARVPEILKMMFENTKEKNERTIF